jgi:hypothetical protein
MRKWMSGLMIAALLGCAKHVPAPAPDGIVHGAGFAFSKLDDGNYGVASKNLPALAEAMNQIGCGKKYICEVATDDLEYSVVTVHEKPARQK